ncbi:MAG: hypothetical protein HY862_04950 [Chloroflexi bacterium]|nr:hypothetical protein [Chloroflexota bacterium]
MQSQTMVDTLLHYQTTQHEVCCPAQILVIDRSNGPAQLLMDTLGRLLGEEIAVTEITDYPSALPLLDYSCYDLVVIGLEDKQAVSPTFLTYLRNRQPDLPILLIGCGMSRQYMEFIEVNGVTEAINLPHRAYEVKQVTEHVATQFLHFA